MQKRAPSERPGPRPSMRGGPAGLSRRQCLLGMLGASGSLLGGCGVLPIGERTEASTVGRAALLLPLTGPRADLGQILREAASLGGTNIGASAEIEILDAGATPESAVRAAEAAVAAGARMLIGPLFSDQARAVAAAVPREVPVVALSNDDTLADAGIFVYGVTPLHSARAVMGYARSRGVADIAVAVPPGAFGERSATDVRTVAAELGLRLRPPVVTDDPEALTATLAGTPPDAVYLPSSGPELPAMVRAAKATGAQILGSSQWSALDLADLPELEGSWFAAPDPLRFDAFSQTLQERGIDAGIVAGLVFDGVEMARILGRLGEQTRRGLLRDKGFNGVLGPYRFLESGQTLRGLAVLGVTEAGVEVLGATGA